MEKTITDVLNNTKTILNRDKEYFSASQMVEPFVNRMSKLTDDFRVQVELPKMISKTNDVVDEIYTRVWVQAVLPEEHVIDNHDRVIGMVYGIDTTKPVAKFYKGGLNRACTNLCVFDPEFLNCQPIAASEAIDYSPVDRLMDKEDNMLQFLTTLKDTEIKWDRPTVERMLGNWELKAFSVPYDNGISPTKLGRNVVWDAFKLMFIKEDSPYYIAPDSSSNMFNVYNAFTEVISNVDKNILNKAEKTLLLNHLLKL